MFPESSSSDLVSSPTTGRKTWTGTLVRVVFATGGTRILLEQTPGMQLAGISVPRRTGGPQGGVVRNPRIVSCQLINPVQTSILAACMLSIAAAAFPQAAASPPATGAEMYQAACASCHGNDGQGAPLEAVAFSTPIPDFTDCEFGPREPDVAWLAVIHDGGPARGFDQIMPAFRDALAPEQARMILSHVRTFCTEPSWPNGDLNFPKALVTEKAFPEDEVVVTTTAAVEGPGALTTKAVYERRIGARTQVEFVVPLRAERQSSGDAGSAQWASGVGDMAVAAKRVLLHSRARGHIVSATAEVVTPTGSETKGFGGGHATIEPFLTYGQLLPRDWFVQTQSGVGFPLERDIAREAFWRVTFGKSFTPVTWGRMWSPMVEILGARELATGEAALWDVLPEMQVTLSTRQHVRLNVGVRVPLNEASTRSTTVLTYLLWDWYEGSFFDGW